MAKKVAILGYGIEGQDAEKYFKNLGEDVSILDKKFDENYLQKLEGFDTIVRSPGVYRYLPEIVKAEEGGAEITSALKIFFEKCPGKIIGVTGTKGKGTTCTLIYEILKNAGLDVYLVGNIGKPYLELLPKLTKDSFVVMELSSFQLIDLTKSPHISVVLNITEDHLDWHKDREEYIEAKRNIVRYQKPEDFAVINYDYLDPKSFANLTKANVFFFSRNSIVKGSYVQHVHNVHNIILSTDAKEDIIGTVDKLLLRGEHNWENITAAICAARLAGASMDSIKKVIFTFKGLEHRLELVRTVSGVTFYNDSFATGPQPTIAAINSFTEPETLILGGSDKGLDYKELGNVISEKKNVKNLILIGETKFKIRISLNLANREVGIVELDKTNMTEIVEIAFKVTEPGGVVILSPASASFDMFENYKDRGNQFKEAVNKLNEKEN